MGLAEFETFIASGNMIFETKARDPAALERKVESQLHASFGIEIDTFVRTENELAAIVDDARANTARLTPEQRLAAALDTRVIEEDLGDGRRRIRQGANCVIVKPARIGQLTPFDEAAARMPALVGECP